MCRLAGIHNKSVLLQVVRQGDPQKMLALLEKIASQRASPASRSARTPRRPSRAGPKASPSTSGTSSTRRSICVVSFNKKSASKDDIDRGPSRNILQELRKA